MEAESLRGGKKVYLDWVWVCHQYRIRGGGLSYVLAFSHPIPKDPCEIPCHGKAALTVYSSK